MYAVSSEIGCTAINGDMAVDVPAGGQSVILALDKKLIIDGDDDAKFVEVRCGTNAAVGSRPRDPEVAATNIDADFLESTGTQWIDTGYVPDNESGILLDQEKRITGDLVPMGSRNDGFDTRFYAVRSSYNSKEGSSAGYGWGGWRAVDKIPGRQKTKLNYLNSRKVEGALTLGLPELPFVPNQPIYMFAANMGGVASLVWGGRIYEAVISQGESIAMSFVPALDTAGVPCMYDTVSKKPFYNKYDATPFIIGFDTTEKAAVSLSKLPITSGGTLTVSLPAEAEDTATLVPAAIDIAKSRGWTIITQYRED